MSNSTLVNCVKRSPNCTKPRNKKIDTITIHHTAGVMSAAAIGNTFAPVSRQASCNYGIGNDGQVILVVDEENRSWCSSSPSNDHRAITIEVSNSKSGGNWPVGEKAMNKLIELCVDICKRNDIKKLNYTGDKTGNLTLHKWFAATACPGPYLEGKMPWIAEQVNKQLSVSDKKTATATTNSATSTTASSTVATNASSLKAGAAVKLSKVNLYTSATAKTASSTKTGTYYIWSNDVSNKRIRITNKTKNVGKSGQVTGWINVSDAEKSLVNASYKVQVTTDSLRIRSGAGITHKTVGYITDRGIYTIVETKSGWGKLKSGQGWISLSYTKKV